MAWQQACKGSAVTGSSGGLRTCLKSQGHRVSFRPSTSSAGIIGHLGAMPCTHPSCLTHPTHTRAPVTLPAELSGAQSLYVARIKGQ